MISKWHLYNFNILFTRRSILTVRRDNQRGERPSLTVGLTAHPFCRPFCWNVPVREVTIRLIEGQRRQSAAVRCFDAALPEGGEGKASFENPRLELTPRYAPKLGYRWTVSERAMRISKPFASRGESYCVSGTKWSRSKAGRTVLNSRNSIRPLKYALGAGRMVGVVQRTFFSKVKEPPPARAPDPRFQVIAPYDFVVVF